MSDIWAAQSRFKKEIESATRLQDLETAFDNYIRGYKKWLNAMPQHMRDELAQEYSGDPSAMDFVSDCIGIVKGVGAAGEWIAAGVEVYDFMKDVAEDGWEGLFSQAASHTADKAKEKAWEKIVPKLERAWRRMGYSASRNQRKIRRAIERTAKAGVKTAGALAAPVTCVASIIFTPSSAGLPDHVMLYRWHLGLMESHANAQFKLAYEKMPEALKKQWDNSTLMYPELDLHSQGHGGPALRVP